MADRQCAGRSRWAGILTALTFGASVLSAGSGTIDQGKLDLLVYFVYDEPNPDSWEPLFEQYSELLFNATEGGLQLGTVSFTLCEYQKAAADVWILNDTSGARAHLNGLGVSGRHMTISQVHKSISGGAIGQFGLVHETGHYVWGCYDEYKGFVGNTPQTHASHYCSSESGTSGCFMDGGTTVFPNNQRTEFCTNPALGFGDTSHFTGVTQGGQAIRNDQEYYLGQSCWERIETSGKGSLSHPTTAPTDVLPPHEAVQFDYARLNGVLSMALVIDTSGSMSSEDKMELAIQSAQVAVGLMLDGEYLTVVAFDDDATVLLQATEVNDSVKATANQRIAALAAGGGTAMGDAVLAATAQLDRVNGCKEFLVVLSDGVSSPPSANDPTVVQALQAGGYDVFSVALGNFSDDDALVDVAAQTGGQFYKAEAAEQLPGTFATIFAQASGATAVDESFEAVLGAGDSREETFSVADRGGLLRISLSFPSGATLALTLHAPDGSSIDFDLPPTGVTRFESEVQKTLTIADPVAGDWRAEIRDLAGTATTFDFLAFHETLDLAVTVGSAQASVVFPEPMQVTTSVVAGVPVGGAEVTAEVQRPDGSAVDIVLHDDGLAVHGDEKSNDAIYSTLFTQYVGDGPYRFDVNVVNVDGQAASNQECGIFGLGEEGQTFDPVPPFVACATHTVLLAGLPQPADRGVADLLSHGTARPVPELVLESSAPTPLGAFSVEVSPHEPLRLGAVTFSIDRGAGASDRLEGLALHLDGDGDGEVDRPSIPLAKARLDSQGRLVFGDGGAALALLAPGSANRFLVTGGEALAASQSGTLGAPRFPWRWLWIPLAWLAVRGLERAFARRRRAVHPSPVGSIGTVTLGALVLFAGCRDGGSDRGFQSFTVGLDPANIELEGAVTGDPALLRGDAMEFRFRLR